MSRAVKIVFPRQHGEHIYEVQKYPGAPWSSLFLLLLNHLPPDSGNPLFSLLTQFTSWYLFSSCAVQLLSHVWLLQTHGLQHARPPCLSITNSQRLLKLMFVKSVMSSNHFIICHPLLLLPSIFPSIKVFSNKSVLHIRWPKDWSFSFSFNPFSDYSGLISFRMDWLDLLAIQGTQESSPTPQFKSINSSVLSFLSRSTLTSIHNHWKP